MTPEDFVTCLAWEIRGLNRAMDIMVENHDKMMEEMALLIESKEGVLADLLSGDDDE